MPTLLLPRAPQPLVGILPHVKVPTPEERQRLTPRTKLFWTFCALLVYLICSQVPLYGINKGGNSDPFYLMRVILASNRNTLMELGISPIITSGMIMQVLVGAKIIDVDLSTPRDQRLYQAASKILGIVMCLGSSVAYVLSGWYGPIQQLGSVTAVLIIVQLFVAGMIVVMLDDLLSKGYGIAGGLNLFLVTNICENILWQMFSPMTYNQGGQTQFEGAIVSVFHLLLTDPNKGHALNKVLFREGLPNVSNVIATIVVFLVVIYVEGLKYDVMIKSSQAGSRTVSFPIKLFYTSNMPIILLTGVISNVYFFSQIFYKRYEKNPFVRLLGVWAEDPASGRSRPIWGISYLISPPEGVFDLVARPLHSLFYISFMLMACGLFARAWIELSSSGPNEVYAMIQRQFGGEMHADDNYKSAKIVLATARDKEGGKGLLKELRKVIPTASLVGGMCIAALSIFADLFGAIGTGTGILMAVTIIFDMYDKLTRDLGPGGVQKLLEDFWKDA
jgi:protein transport protein SEC61 subunit alpha